jgi:hypothetical protein
MIGWDGMRGSRMTRPEPANEEIVKLLERIAALLGAQDAKYPKYTSIYISFLYLDI